MKKYISLITATAVSLVASAYQVPDSLSTYNTSHADSIIIIQNTDGVTVEVMSIDQQGHKTVTIHQPSDGNMVVKTSVRRAKTGHGLFEKQISKCDSDRTCAGSGGVWDVGMGFMSIGFTAALSQSPQTSIEMGKSLEIGLPELLALRYNFPDKKNAFEIGFGLNWRNFRTTMSEMFVPTSDGVELMPYPEGVVPKYSRLKVFSLILPVLYKFTMPVRQGQWNTGFYIGGIVNFNTHASALTVWDDANADTQKTSCNDIYPRKVTIDILAGIRVYNSLSLFVKYSPMKTLQKGPQFSSLTTGLMIGL